MFLEALAAVGVGSLLFGSSRPVRIERRTVIREVRPEPKVLPPVPSIGLPSGTREFVCEHDFVTDPVKCQRECSSCGTTVTEIEWALGERGA